MLNRKIFLEIKKGEIKKYRIKGNKLYEFSDKLKGKNLKVLVEGEALLSRVLKFPLNKNMNLKEMIFRELEFIFNSLENIFFNFEILEKTKKEVTILVTLVNNESFKNLKEFYVKNKIHSIKVIQKEVLASLGDKIKEKNYNVVFEKNNISYYMEIREGIIRSNFIKDGSLLDHREFFEELLKNQEFKSFKVEADYNIRKSEALINLIETLNFSKMDIEV